MRDYVQAALGIGFVFGVYTILGRLASSWLPMISLFTLAVVYIGLRKGELIGALAGTTSGLLVDAFSVGVFGISGLTLTVTGYLSGLIAKRIQIQNFLRTFFFVGLMTLVESSLWLVLVRLILSERSGRVVDILAVRPAVTGAVGAVVVAFIRRQEARRGR